MKKLFGASKKEEPKQPAPSLAETSSKVIEILAHVHLVGRSR